MSDVLTPVLSATGGVAAIAHLTAHPTNRRTIPTAAGRTRQQHTRSSQARMPEPLVLEPLHLEGEEP